MGVVAAAVVDAAAFVGTVPSDSAVVVTVATANVAERYYINVIPKRPKLLEHLQKYYLAESTYLSFE